MKKIFIFLFAAILVVFVYLTLFKIQTSEQVAKIDREENSQEKQRIREFWNHYRVATDLRMDGEYEKAASEYVIALEINDIHEDALYYLGNMYYLTGRYKEAENCWTKMIVVNSRNPRAHFQLGNMYLNYEIADMFDISKAEREFRRTLELNKEETAPTLYLGQISLINSNIESAGSYFLNVIGSNATSVEAHYLQGYITWKEGNPDKAYSHISQAIIYAKPELIKDEVIGEGDTRSGSAPPKPADRSIFNQFLVPLTSKDPNISIDEMEEEYRKLDTFLINLRSK